MDFFGFTNEMNNAIFCSLNFDIQTSQGSQDSNLYLQDEKDHTSHNKYFFNVAPIPLCIFIMSISIPNHALPTRTIHNKQSFKFPIQQK
jgi:hypothetical protein